MRCWRIFLAVFRREKSDALLDTIMNYLVGTPYNTLTHHKHQGNAGFNNALKISITSVNKCFAKHEAFTVYR